jgi:hypothetical protein
MSNVQKLELAIRSMGERYCLHPSNRVSRIPASQQQTQHKTDLASLFKKIYKRMEAEK